MSKPKLKKIRAGLYEIVDCKCGDCGGQVRTESLNASGERISNSTEFRWETHCKDCKKCDPNGWPNLDMVLRKLNYWKRETPNV